MNEVATSRLMAAQRHLSDQPVYTVPSLHTQTQVYALVIYSPHLLGSGWPISCRPSAVLDSPWHKSRVRRSTIYATHLHTTRIPPALTGRRRASRSGSVLCFESVRDSKSLTIVFEFCEYSNKKKTLLGFSKCQLCFPRKVWDQGHVLIALPSIVAFELL